MTVSVFTAALAWPRGPWLVANMKRALLNR